MVLDMTGGINTMKEDRPAYLSSMPSVLLWRQCDFHKFSECCSGKKHDLDVQSGTICFTPNYQVLPDCVSKGLGA